jgi:uncharacterized SAM-binding protein YcdF (DUF218 family)
MAKLAALAVLVTLLLLAAPYLLEAYARWLVVEEDPTPRSDVVVALSGGDGERLHASIQLYRVGLAKSLLIVGSDVPLLKVYSNEDSLTQGEAKRRIAVRRGVPEDSVLVALGPTSTLEEAARVLEEARTHQWRSIIVVTDPFHTRRSRATFRSVFKGTGVRIALYHLPEGRSSQNTRRWWRRESDFIAVTTETLKLGFYAYRHGIFPWG